MPRTFEPKHSPTPFHVSPGRFGRTYGPFYVASILDARNEQVAHVLELGDEDTNPQAVGNAVLLAAAGDLLAAAIEGLAALRSARSLGVPPDDWVSEITGLAAAIAKATGSEPADVLAFTEPVHFYDDGGDEECP